VIFLDGNGCTVQIEELSDGFRSMLSLTLDLIRHLVIAYGQERVFDSENLYQIAVPGVVLIDEVDAHLHPTWQKRIGFWFLEHFPQMQFIVTTHSPLVCQAAEQGSIFLLPRPGTDETGRMLEGEEKNRLLYGNILDAYSTEAFGYGKVARSERSQELLAELAVLSRKEIKTGLSDKEQERQEELRAMLPTESPLF
ncbi:MAG: AAA family ATPase, partial [Armatimonadetes bacterium]|nr:AAA family ATPase [Armatimonadota bacterium]